MTQEMETQLKLINLDFKNKRISIAMSSLGDCWWSLKDLCKALELLREESEDEECLLSVAKTFRINSCNLKEIAITADEEPEIMLSLPGLERLVDYAGELSIVNDFCQWMIDVAFPTIWEKQQDIEEVNEEEDTVILVGGQKQETSEISQPGEDGTLLIAA